jgi:hypothetical protein
MAQNSNRESGKNSGNENMPRTYASKPSDQDAGENSRLQHLECGLEKKPLIQEHAFWEIRNGQNALFWTDSWQQLPPLQLEENLQSYENHIQDLATLKVADMWTNIPNNSPWRSWKSTHQELQVAMDCDLQHWKQETIQR